MWILKRSFRVCLLYVSFSHEWQTYIKSSSNQHSHMSPTRLTSPDFTMIHRIIGSPWLSICVLCKNVLAFPCSPNPLWQFSLLCSRWFWFKNPINAMLHKALIWHFNRIHLNSQLVKDLMDEDQPFVTGCISKSVSYQIKMWRCWMKRSF